MLVIVGLTIVILAAVGVVLYATLESFSSVERQAAFVRNIQRMDQIVSTLTSAQRLAGGAGRMTLPAPAIEGTQPVLPGWLGVERKTPWGEFYTYCVFAHDSAETSDPVIAGRRMASQEVGFPGVGTRAYVVRADQPTVSMAGLRALILSGSPSSPQSPTCDDAIFDNGLWRVTRGSARVVLEQIGGAFGLQASAASPGPVVLYATNDLETGEGKTGASPNDATTLAEAIAAWQTGRYAAMTIRLLPSASAYTLPPAVTDLSGAGEPRGRVLRLQGDDASQPSVLALGVVGTRASLELNDLSISMGTVSVDGAPLRLNGVAFGGSLQASGSHVEIDQSTVASLVVKDGSRMVARRSTLQAVSAEGADLTFGTDASVAAADAPALVARGSRITVTADQACGSVPFGITVAGADPATVPGVVLFGSELHIAGRDVQHVRISTGQNPFSFDAASRVVVAERLCAGGAEMPRLRETAAGADAGPLQSFIPPFFDPVAASAACTSATGVLCQVEAVCPAGRKATRGECGITQITGSLVLLRRFGYGSGDRFVCEMARPLDAEAEVTATAMCQR